jgi:NAD(P)-dependent dehydrogenase (short-subunit alcohol dehydrogenase family)
MMPGQLTVVTGAGSGIGAATARLLAQRGHRVVALGRNRATLDAVVDTLDAGAQHLAIGCDVTQPSSIAAAFSTIHERAGIPTGLINAAGICVPAPLPTITVDDWNATITTNLTGSFLMAQAMAVAICDAGLTGSIVNIASEAASVGMPHYVAYCASKAGVLGMTRALAAELAPTIRVNALCPGPVDTPMLHAEMALSDDPAAAWSDEIARVPLRAVATAEDVADAAVWLLTAPGATAAVLPIDGGTTAAFYGAKA